MGEMDQASLIADLKGLLQDSSKKFTAASDADFVRHLDVAVAAMSRVRPRVIQGEITLQSGIDQYDAPAGFISMDHTFWGNAERRTRKQWESNCPGPAPRVTVINAQPLKQIILSPAPSATHIADLGAAYKFYYRALHIIDAAAANTTIDPADRDLLLIRATAQAMLELAADGIAKPVKLGNQGVGSMPKNGTPAALADQLMKLFGSMAGD